MSMLQEYQDALAVCRAHDEPVSFTVPYAGSATDYAYLRDYITREAALHYGVSADIFDQATVTSTTLLRDFIHKATYFHDELQTYTSLSTSSQALPLELDVAPLLRHDAWALCGEISWQLFHVYTALGYECRAVNTLNGPLDDFDDGHVFVEVRDAATGALFIQDPTYNVAHVGTDGSLLDLQALRAATLDADAATGSTPLGGAVYTYYHATGVVADELGEPYASFVSVDAIKTPWRFWGSDGSYGSLGDFRDASRPALQDTDQLAALVQQAKDAGHGYEATVALLAAEFDLVGIGFLDEASGGYQSRLVCARMASGSDVTLDFDTLQSAAGGVDAYWAGVFSGQPVAGLPSTDYTLPYRVLGAGGLSAEFETGSIGTDGSREDHPLDFAYGDTQTLTVASDADHVLATYHDYLGSETWSTWAEMRQLETGLLARVNAINDDGSRYSMQQDLGAQAWDFKEQSFTATGIQASARTVNDDASAYQAWWDVGDLGAWAMREQTFSSSGLLLSTKVTNDDGSAYQQWLDPTGNAAWYTREQNTTVGGQVTTSRTLYDDGSAFQAWWDVSDAANWSRSESFTDAQGRLSSSKVVSDSGAIYQSWWDVSATATWSLRELSSNAQGQRLTERLSNDDGSAYQAWWDVSNGAAWWLTEHNINAAGQLVSSRTVNDNGTIYQAWWDVTGESTWAVCEHSRDAQGRLVSARTTADDGSAYQAWWDVDGLGSWATREQTFSAAGSLLGTKVTNDDGSSYQDWLDLQGLQTWSYRERTADAQGRATAERIVNDDGSSYRAWWDVADTLEWSFKEQTFNASGALVAERIVLDDGSVSTTRSAKQQADDMSPVQAGTPDLLAQALAYELAPPAPAHAAETTAAPGSGAALLLADVLDVSPMIDFAHLQDATAPLDESKPSEPALEPLLPDSWAQQFGDPTRIAFERLLPSEIIVT